VKPAVRFGFLLFPYSRFGDAQEIADTVRDAEAAGFSTCVLPHHLLPPAWPQAAPTGKVWYDPLVLSSSLAAQTSRLTFRTGVLVVPLLQPVALAKAVATLDAVSGGRFRLGVGIGWMRAEFRRLGLSFEDRASTADEYLRAMKELWTAESPSFAGKHVSFDDVSFLPRPTSNRIPIDIGGSGPRVFRLVAELGDGWCPLTRDHDEIARGISEIKQLYAAHDRDPDEPAVSVPLPIDTDPELAAMKSHVRAGRQPGLGRGDPTEPRAASAAECIEEVETLRALGVTDVTVECAWETPADFRDKLRWFADAVLPTFSDPVRAGSSRG
jgi:probable F420-dependent oxidoreductase